MLLSAEPERPRYRTADSRGADGRHERGLQRGAGSFGINASTGQLWSKAPLDYETQAAYSLVVSVQDGRDFNGDPDTAVAAEVTVTIAVVNVAEPGSLVLPSSGPHVGIPFAARLTDPDGVVGEAVWKWERSRDGNLGSSPWRAIGGAESAAYAPVEGDVGHYLRVTASYEDGHGHGVHGPRVLRRLGRRVRGERGGEHG